MTAIEQAAKLLPDLTRAEKAQLLQWVVQDLGSSFPGIESNPDVCGGEPCIAGTRIQVWFLEQSRRLGMSEAELLGNFPGLHAEDLVNAWAYVRSNQSQIDAQINDNENA